MVWQDSQFRWALAIGGIAFLIRLAVGFMPGTNHLVHDSTVYLLMAAAIVDGDPIESFPNGYPLLLAVPRLLLSQRETVLFAVGMNALASAATVVLCWYLGRLWWPRCGWKPLVVAGALTIFPHQLRYVQLVMSEVPGQFLLLTSLVILVESLRSDRWRDPNYAWHRFFAGLVLHMAVAVRPSFSLAFPLLLAYLAFRRLGIKGTSQYAAGFLIGILLMFGLERGGIVKPSQAPANNLLIAIRSTSSATQFVLHPEEDRRQAIRLYAKFATSQPLAFLRQRAESLWELWGPFSLPGYRNDQEGMVVKAVLLVRPILLLAGLWGWWRGRRDHLAWVFGLPVLGLTIIHTLTFSNHRFIAPIEPLLFLLVGAAWTRRRSPDTSVE